MNPAYVDFNLIRLGVTPLPSKARATQNAGEYGIALTLRAIQNAIFFGSTIVDMTFRTEEGTFNYRVCAIIVHGGKLLAMKDGRSPYYYLPGGRVELHETMENAILRELKEEMKIDAIIERPLWLNQSFFVEDVDHERYHEICVYFLVDIGRSAFPTAVDTIELYENEKRLTFEWLRLEDLEKKYLYPNFIKKEIFRLPNELKIITEHR